MTRRTAGSVLGMTCQKRRIKSLRLNGQELLADNLGERFRGIDPEPYAFLP